MGDEWPLVGRDAELREYARLVVHDRRSLVLAGPAGVGKTRLALELLEMCKRAGLGTIRVTATSSSASLPLGAFAPFLPPFDPAASGRVDDRADLLRRTAAALVASASPRRLIVFVDDAHRLDDASATLVYQLAETKAAAVVVTVRRGEPAPEPVVTLWKDGLADRRDVIGLSDFAMGDLLSHVLHGPLDPGAVAQLVERSSGNVLFLRELVVGALETSALRNDGGIWRLTGALVPSDRLSELVGARLRGLSPEEGAMLELVAVAEPLRAQELAALGDPVVAEQLERKRLLASTLDVHHRLTIGFAHPLYGEVVRKDMPALQRQVLARSLADAVEAAGASQEDLLRVATWRLEGGGGRPEQMLAAATLARWHYDFALAEQLARAAQEGGAGFDADLLMAQLVGLQGRGEDAESEFASLARRAKDDAERGAVALSRIDNVAFYLGRPADGVRLAEEAEAAVEDPGWRDEIQARRSALVFALDGPRAGADVATPLIERADGRALVWAAQVAAFTLGRLGRVEEGLKAAERGYAAHLTVAQPMDWYPWTHLFFRCQVLSWSGRLSEANDLALEQYHLAVVEHSKEAQAWFAWHQASMASVRGDIVTAAQRGREAVALFRELGRPQFMAFALTYVAMALALSGEASETREALKELDDLGTSDLFMGVDGLQARAWASVAEGDLPRARQILEQAAEKGEEIGDLVGRASALHGLARLGHAREVQATLTLEAERIEGKLVQARAAHARALARNDADELTRVSSTFESMSAYLLAAEAAADAAVAWRRSGDLRRATSAERQAQLLADRCQGAVTPALQTIEARAALSRAERDAALLAAAGRSNKEIAEELCLSVRTVEGRLQRAYTRLGVGSRSELAEALETMGADTPVARPAGN